MLAHLIRKEILDQILSLRFLVLSLIGAVAIWLSLASGLTFYRTQVRDYRASQALSDQHLRHLAEADKVSPWNPFMELNHNPGLANKPPTPMCIFVRGLEPGLGRSIPAWGDRGSGRPELSPLAVSPLLGVLSTLDLTVVVQVLFGLFVLLYTFDAICGEKERGTLRLVASFPVPRHRLIFGKFLGAVIPIVTAFGVAVLAGIAVVLTLPNVALSDSDLLRLGAILLVSVVYMSTCACAGLLASCLTRGSAAAFVLLLSFWVSTVVVLPRVSFIAADAMRPAPSVHEHLAENARLGTERLEKHRELRRAWQETHSVEGQEFWRTPEGRESFRLFYHDARYVADESVEPAFRRLEESYKNRYQARFELAVALARPSPAFALKNAIVRVAGTGMTRDRRFREAYERYLVMRTDWFRNGSTQFTLKQANPGKYGEPEWVLPELQPFSYAQPVLAEDVQSALLDFTLIVIWGALFLFGAAFVVLRYDVR
jgi:ABC-type transport system involved in multi-copper enzyme maturation permease subunit